MAFGSRFARPICAFIIWGTDVVDRSLPLSIKHAKYHRSASSFFLKVAKLFYFTCKTRCNHPNSTRLTTQPNKMFIPTADPKKDLRLPLIGFLPNKIRNHFIAMMAEFVGTFMFLFFSFSATQVANASAPMTSGDSGLTQVPNVAILLYISLAFGFSLAVNAWVFFRVSGGLFNPAVGLLKPPSSYRKG